LVIVVFAVVDAITCYVLWTGNTAVSEIYR